jgi:hypothetical protein
MTEQLGKAHYTTRTVKRCVAVMDAVTERTDSFK